MTAPDTPRSLDATRTIRDYPGEPAAHQKAPKVVLISPSNATTGSREVPVPAREVGKPDTPAKKHKAPTPTSDKRWHRDVVILDAQKRSTEAARARDVLEEALGSKVGTPRSASDNDEAPVPGRKAERTKAGAAAHHPPGRSDGHDD